jgi:hypothetical protein
VTNLDRRHAQVQPEYVSVPEGQRSSASSAASDGDASIGLSRIRTLSPLERMLWDVADAWLGPGRADEPPSVVHLAGADAWPGLDCQACALKRSFMGGPN